LRYSSPKTIAVSVEVSSLRSYRASSSPVGRVEHAYERVANLAEGLRVLDGPPDRDCEDNLVNFGWYRGEVERDAFFVARPFVMLPGLPDRTLRAGEVEVEHEVLVGEHLAIGLDPDGAGVEVEVRAIGGMRVPTEANVDGVHARGACLLGEREGSALRKTDSHGGTQLCV